MIEPNAENRLGDTIANEPTPQRHPQIAEKATCAR